VTCRGVGERVTRHVLGEHATPVLFIFLPDHAHNEGIKTSKKMDRSWFGLLVLKRKLGSQYQANQYEAHSV
jgi:hypothetical protein